MYSYEICELFKQVIEDIPSGHWQGVTPLPPETQQDPVLELEGGKPCLAIGPNSIDYSVPESNRRGRIASLNHSKIISVAIVIPYELVQHEGQAPGSPWSEFCKASKYHELLIQYLATYDWSQHKLQVSNIDNIPYPEIGSGNSFFASQTDFYFEFQSC